MTWTIKNNDTGDVLQIVRSVTATHPTWVHQQCETESESELQSLLDSYSVSDFTGPEDRDVCGIAPAGVLQDAPLPLRQIMLAESSEEWQATPSGGIVITLADGSHEFVSENRLTEAEAEIRNGDEHPDLRSF